MNVNVAIAKALGYVGACLVLAAVAICGCVPPEEARAPVSRPLVRDNPTAERMHDLCGSLLLFYGANHRLPLSIDELCVATSLDVRKAVDPTTGRAFSYNQGGMAWNGEGRRLVMHAEPVAGERFRWCIAVSHVGSSMVADVVPVPIDQFDAAANAAKVSQADTRAEARSQ